MSEHESIRALLALAAADALEEQERRRVEAHVAQCDACRRELAAYDTLAATLRRAPTPQPRPELVLRVQGLAAARLPAQRDQPHMKRLLPALVLASWVAVLASWPLLNSTANGLMQWLNLPLAGAWKWAVNYTLVGGTLATAGAMAFALRVMVMRRVK